MQLGLPKKAVILCGGGLMKNIPLIFCILFPPLLFLAAIFGIINLIEDRFDI